MTKIDFNKNPKGIQTKEEWEEYLRCKLDPVYFLDTYGFTLNPVKGKVRFRLYPFQKRAMQDFLDYVFNICLKPRQMGMSWLVGGYVLWLAIFHTDKNILMISIKENAAKRLLDKVKYIYINLPDFLKCGYDEWIKTTIVFKTGSRIDSVPTSEEAGRSEACSLLVVDEAAFVRWIDEIWAAAFPTLSTGGQAILLSTANGVGNFFHRTWTKAVKMLNDFHSIKLHWRDHPDRDDAWYRRQERNLGKRRTAQEVDCDFLKSGATVFDIVKLKDVEEELLVSPKPILEMRYNGSLQIFKHPEHGRAYCIGADVASGGGEDYSACYVMDIETKEIMAQYKEKLPVDRYAVVLHEVGIYFNNALLAVEDNNHGHAVLLKLREMLYPNLYYRYDYDKDKPTDKVGWYTSVATKPMIINDLEAALRLDQIPELTMEFVQEGYVYNYLPDGSTGALDGYNDDLVMAMAITLAATKYKAKKVDLPFYVA